MKFLLTLSLSTCADPQSCRNSWKCDFLPSAERLVISDGRRIGARRDLSGVFLLDSILQDAGNENLMIELPLSEVRFWSFS